MEQKKQQAAMNENPSCIEMTIAKDPVAEDDIVFFFAGISHSGHDNQGNFRYVIERGGVLYYAMNKGGGEASFNKPLEEITKLTGKQQQKIFNFLEQNGFFEKDAVVDSPENIHVQDGLDHFIVADMGGRRNCVKYEPGNEIELEMEEMMNQLIRE